MQFAPSYKLIAQAADTTPAQTVLDSQVIPVINWATSWGSAVGWGVLGSALFYLVIINIIRPTR